MAEVRVCASAQTLVRTIFYPLVLMKDSNDDILSFKPRSLEPQSAVLSLPPFEHKEPADDDCGLPKHPIYSNYPKYLWTSHKRSGGLQIVNKHGEPNVRS